jgi:starch synthase
LLASRTKYVSGILNGIDTQAWDPKTDEFIEQNYDAQRLDLKPINKKALQRELGLNADVNVPLCGVVSRFTYQKGLDLLLEAAHEIISLPTQLVLLGTGERVQQEAFTVLARSHPESVAVVIEFSERLAHLIEAGSDIFLMPSRYEPCGLNQMYSQRYGTPPVVHATGGLADSVVDCDSQTLENATASGFSFHVYSPTEFIATVKRAVHAYKDKKTWTRIQQIAMAKDFTWTSSATEYLRLYQSLIKN